MKVSTCYNCGSGERTFYASENGYSLVKCAGCGLLYVDERPEDAEITQAHRQGKHGGEKEADATGSFVPDKIPQYLSVLDDLYGGRMGHISAWLDVGCGHGEFIAAVQQYSKGATKLKGTEPNVRKQESARKRGLDVGYFDLDEHDEKYDCISLLNVYSHLPDPPEFIASLKRLLNPCGELLIQTGDTCDLLSKDHYRPLYLPNHLSFASEKIVVEILGRAGFETVGVRKYPFLDLGPAGVAKELLKALHPKFRSSLRYVLKRRLYTQADMFVRARLISNR